MSLFYNLGFQTPASDSMYNIIYLYGEILGIFLFILFSIIYLIDYCLVEFNYNKMVSPSFFNKKSEINLDFFFLLLPSFCVVYILIPTLGFLYNDFNLDFESMDPFFEISVCGRQWYWSYFYNYQVYSDLLGSHLVSSLNFVFGFDSILVSDNYKNRLLSVDHELVVPVNRPVLLSITSSDVIHSFALPQVGLKIDAIPGRIAYGVLCFNLCGSYYGQCSELCGVYHGFMPIVVNCVSMNECMSFLFLNSV